MYVHAKVDLVVMVWLTAIVSALTVYRFPGLNWHTHVLIVSDIDECAEGSHTCDALASCTDTLGSYTCVCSSGYTGNGETCSGNHTVKKTQSLSSTRRISWSQCMLFLSHLHRYSTYQLIYRVL